MSRFRAGQLDVLTTVDLFNEGVDVPDVDLLIFMRATHSRRIFVQQLGRGLRVRAGRDKVVVLDFVTDLRRIAEVIQLDATVRSASVEQLGLGGRLIEFSNRSAGSFLREWKLRPSLTVRSRGWTQRCKSHTSTFQSRHLPWRAMNVPDDIREQLRYKLYE